MAVTEERVSIVGAGPVGMTAAARLPGSGVPVTVLLAEVWNLKADIKGLDLNDRQWRTVTLDAMQKQTIQNKRDLEAASAEGLMEQLCSAD